MKIADLSGGSGQLREAMEVLQRSWRETQEHWRDANSRRLEDDHLQPLARAVASTFPAIQHLAAALAEAERECGEW